MKRKKKVKDLPVLISKEERNPTILALDVSTARTGWCVGVLIDGEPFTGSILPDPEIVKKARKAKRTLAEYHAETFISIARQISALVDQYKCSFVVIEALPYVRNIRATMTLAMLHGVILCMLKEEHCIDAIYLPVPQIRSLIQVGKLVGNRDEKKEQIRSHLLKLGIPTANTDESDAAAVFVAAQQLYGEKND